eukprot:COSAG02_NODE_345_length_24135_cov_6.425404_19_plen_75_part_00
MLILAIVRGLTTTNKTAGALQKVGVYATARDRAGANLRTLQSGRCGKRDHFIHRMSGGQAGKAGAYFHSLSLRD